MTLPAVFREMETIQWFLNTLDIVEKNHHRNDSWIGVGNQCINGSALARRLPILTIPYHFVCVHLPSTGLLDNGNLSVVCRIVASKRCPPLDTDLCLCYLTWPVGLCILNRDVEMR